VTVVVAVVFPFPVAVTTNEYVPEGVPGGGTGGVVPVRPLQPVKIVPPSNKIIANEIHTGIRSLARLIHRMREVASETKTSANKAMISK
jgi:hypothetical protein